MSSLPFALANCGGENPATPDPDPPGVPGTPAVASIEIAEDFDRTPLVGDSIALSATAFDVAGEPLPDVKFEWVTAWPSRAQVTEDGVLVAVAPGHTDLVASAGETSRSIVIRVLAVPEVIDFAIANETPGIVPGGTLQIPMSFLDAEGSSLEDGYDQELELFSSQPGVVSVERLIGAIAVTGHDPGVSTIRMQLRDATAEIDIDVTSVVFDSMAANGSSACGLTTDGQAWCWGNNGYGALGYGVLEAHGSPNLLPRRVAGERSFRSISVGDERACAIAMDDRLYCWGRLWSGGPEGVAAPTEVAPALDLRFRMVSAGHTQICGVTVTSDAYCWGENRSGQIGNGVRGGTYEQPTSVVGGISFDVVSSNWGEVSCGLSVSGETFCWGFNRFGNAGVDGEDHLVEPTMVTGAPEFTALSVSGVLSCGQAGNDLYCWGEPYGAGEPLLVPSLRHDELEWDSFSTSRYFSCGVTTDGQAYCLGDLAVALGNGTGTPSPSDPIGVAGGLDLAYVHAGVEFACGQSSTTGDVYCWGDSSYGQVGQNDRDDRSTPARVLGQP